MMRRRTLADREDVLAGAMLAPALGYVILLVGVPFVLAIVLSFSNATAGSLRFGWAGLRNYAAILADPIFLRALRNSAVVTVGSRSEEHTSELQSQSNLVCRLLLEKKKKNSNRSVIKSNEKTI